MPAGGAQQAWEEYMRQHQAPRTPDPSQSGAGPYMGDGGGYQAPQGASPTSVATTPHSISEYGQMILDPHSSPLGGITSEVFTPGNKYLEAGAASAASAIPYADAPLAGYQAALNDLPAVMEAQRLNPFDLQQYSAGDALSLQGIGQRGLGPSAWQNFQVDPTGRAAQTGALDYYQGLMQGGGTDAVAEAEYAKRRGQAEQLRRSQDEATQAQMQARGMGGSGQELLGSLMANQGAASDAHQAGLDAAAIAQQRRDNAGVQAAGIGYGLAGQDFAQGAARNDAMDQNARDAWDRWYQNATYNSGVGNEAAAQNWNRNNQVSDSNVALQNQATMYNKGLAQQGWNNRMGALEGFTGAAGQAAQARQNLGSTQQAQGAQTKNPIEGAVGFIGGLLGGGLPF